MTSAEPVDLLVDWDLAARAATRLAGGGPRLSTAEARDAVAVLRQAAARSEGFVAHTARMSASADTPVLIVDRGGWAQANAAGMRELIAPALASVSKMVENPPNAAVAAVGKRVTGTEVGTLLAFLATKILGQFDPFRAAGGRLLLVAPNIVAAEQEMGVDPMDFRLWVCLHEETHRVQFGANPWLAPYLSERIRTLAADLFATRDVIARLNELSHGLTDLVRGQDGPSSLVEAFQTPAQRQAMAELTAIMSLLEGHADVVMDAVGPDVVPSVEIIRAKFSHRREGMGSLDRLLRRLLGLEAKMRQYADGAAFVRGVQARVGVDGFNAIWTSPETLPTPAEIESPALWVRRVHSD